MTIAEKAPWGVETVHHDQRRGLLPQPERLVGRM
jgi:hypothetical protein